MSVVNIMHRCKLPKGSIVQLNGTHFPPPDVITTIDSERDIYFEAGTTLEHVYPDVDKSIVQYTYSDPRFPVYEGQLVDSIIFNIIQLVEL